MYAMAGWAGHGPLPGGDLARPIGQSGAPTSLVTAVEQALRLPLRSLPFSESKA